MITRVLFGLTVVTTCLALAADLSQSPMTLYQAPPSSGAADKHALQLSDAIRVSQAGYRVDGVKRAIVAAAIGDTVRVRRVSDAAIILEVPLGRERAEPDSGDLVREADFSVLNQPGEYVLEIENVGTSLPFRVADDVFNPVFYLAVRSFYGQRCGTDVSLAPDFPQYHYKACHREPAQFHPSSGKSGEIDCTGGWHDAGDYGRYVVNSGITTGTLLWAYELNAEKLKSFPLQIPESGGPLPDMLAEIKWNLDWMLKMQDADGGVWHKSTTAHFPGFVMPEEDRAITFIIGHGDAPFKTTQATADFAAVCAIAGRVYATFDEAYARRCTEAALRAWEWLERTPDHSYTRNPEGIHTGGYGDKDARDERLWAAAELFRTTGHTDAHRYFLDHYRDWKPTLRPDAPQGWPNVENMAFYTYALCTRPEVDQVARQQITQDAIAAADAIVERASGHGYRIPMLPKQYGWGSNSVVANYAMMVQLANRLQPKQAYVEAAADAIHYLCGRNTFNTSFITHVGTKFAMKPHHRPSGADDVEAPWPGLLVGGPNVHQGRGELKDPTRPPARCWIDATESYTMNENAINWNAPLVFVLADLMK